MVTIAPSKRALIYCRVSSEAQRKNGSLEEQEKRCREYCDRLEYMVDSVVYEVFEGPELDRPELHERARRPPSFTRGMNGAHLLTPPLYLCYTHRSRRDVQLVGDRGLHTNTSVFSRRTGVCGHSRRATGAFGSAGGWVA